MKPVILDNIPFQPTPEAIQQVLDTKLGRRSADALEEFLEEGRGIAKPKAIYRLAFVDEKGEDYVEIEGKKFQSRILRQNLEDVHRVFFYVATCGQELNAWKKSQEDALEEYYADTVNGMALDVARDYLITHLQKQYGLGQTSTMNPGSLEDWPLGEQRGVFALLGDTEKAIGVRLLDSLLMHPAKTISGIRYPSESSFASCQLCARANCPNRQALYDAEEYAQRFS